MSREIQSIDILYNSILKNKKVVLGEADISGIDELVYNPITKSGGDVGHGYDKGKRIRGIKWKNHDGHMHIGFTTREVAMAVIDKADDLGLKTTENPYAKKDPTGKVERVHTPDSFHYKIFPGEPKVGGAVDISGDKSKMLELFNWIEKNYASGDFTDTEIAKSSDKIGGLPKDALGFGMTAAAMKAYDAATGNKDSLNVAPLSYGMIVGKMNEMLEHKKDLRRLYTEAPTNSNDLLGGTNFKWGGGVDAHSSRPPYNWASDNAWDIMAPAGTAVYSLTDGKVIKTGGSLVRKKTVWGLSVNVQTGDNEFFYTHLDKLGPKIQVGSEIKKGDLIGYIGTAGDGWPEHVHIGIKSGDISNYMDKSGNIKGHTGGSATDDDGNKQSLEKKKDEKSKEKDNNVSYDDIGALPRDSKLLQMLEPIGKALAGALKESFGKNVISSYGTLIIPAKSNSKIYSPVDGAVDNTKYARSCKNEITIRIKDGSGYLQFCGISQPNVRNGNKVSVGTLLGKTSDDVEVVYFDKSYNRLKLTNDTFVGFGGRDDSEETSNNREKVSVDNREPRYSDPALVAIPSMVLSMFKNKKDPETGDVEKRWGYATEKKPVDPWIVNALSKPFKNIGKALGTKKGRTESKKLKEEIERIKKIL